MSDSMIERVARAISDAEQENPGDYNVMRRAQARAAIEAMREPTPAMLAACMTNPPGLVTAESLDDLALIGKDWAAMIDSALSKDSQ